MKSERIVLFLLAVSVVFMMSALAAQGRQINELAKLLRRSVDIGNAFSENLCSVESDQMQNDQILQQAVGDLQQRMNALEAKR
jgi:cell division protein ZapA (FtsZ GTPase activity inhibitor)